MLGPNGSGKSTLLGAVAGLVLVAEGRVVIGGRVVDDAESGLFVETAARPVGFVFQNYRLFPHLSVVDNVAFGSRAGGRGRPAALAAANTWLARLGLASLADRKPRQLSGGQAQRVALARALAGDPKLLLLDEPLAALDAGTRLDVRWELRQHLAEFPGPCLLVTHEPLDALVLADRVVVLEDGRITQQGTPEQIARRPRTGYVAKLVGLNLYAGYADGACVMLDQGGAFHMPNDGWRGDALVAVHPASISVSTHPPEHDGHTSWPANVLGLTPLADQIRLDLDGRPPAQADVTPAHVAALGLYPGSQVWLSVAPADLEAYPANNPHPDTTPAM